jgi:hypothetical protein
MTETNWIIIFTKIIVVHSENHTKLINTFCGLNADYFNYKGGGTYSNHRIPKGETFNTHMLPAITSRDCALLLTECIYGFYMIPRKKQELFQLLKFLAFWTETDFSLRNVGLSKNVTLDNVQNVTNLH